MRRGYRRSVLGPLWLTLSLAVTVAVLSVLYGQLLGVPLERYVPHLALGFIAWQFIAGVVARSCNVFVRQKAWILNDRRPLSLFVLMDVWESLLEMAHNAPVYVGAALLYGIFAGAAGLQIVPGLALVLLNAVWVGLLLGTVCARFRDIAQIVASVMRIAFFVTPVIWMPEMLGSRAHLALYNLAGAAGAAYPALQRRPGRKSRRPFDTRNRANVKAAAAQRRPGRESRRPAPPGPGWSVSKNAQGRPGRESRRSCQFPQRGDTRDEDDRMRPSS